MRRESSTVVALAGEVHEVLLAGLARSPNVSVVSAGGRSSADEALRHGPWWPPLDDLLGAARRFYAGGLGEPGA